MQNAASMKLDQILRVRVSNFKTTPQASTLIVKAMPLTITLLKIS
jgi:hypothetical protein